jgi:uncharacterized membrane protein YkvI
VGDQADAGEGTGLEQVTGASVWQRYFLPSMVFMSVVIGGGYATGRELAEFFMPAGPIGGLLGMTVAAAVWSVVFALSLELARLGRTFDYRTFFKELLGPGWIAFEIVYLALLVLVLAVLGAATGEMLASAAGAPTWVGTALFIVLIGVLIGVGPAAIERFFSWWGVLLYVGYLVFFAMCMLRFGSPVAAAIAGADAQAGIPASTWISGGLAYAGYNISVAPALLFCAAYQTRRRETMIAGLLAGPVAMLPGMLFFVAMLARYPQIADAPIPLQVLLEALQAPWLSVAMQVVIFGTLVQTGLGVIHGFNERVAASLPTELKPVTVRVVRVAISLGLLLLSIVLATRVGLISLIAKGYGWSGWAILAIYVVPLLTVGAWKIWGRRSGTPAAA